MREIVHGLVLYVTMHFLCVMRQFPYDVCCIHIHVTALLVRNTAVKPTRCYDRYFISSFYMLSDWLFFDEYIQYRLLNLNPSVTTTFATLNQC